MKFLSRQSRLFIFSMLALLLVAGCQSNQTPPATQPEQTSAPAVVTPPAAPPDFTPKILPTARVAVRIKAGSSSPLTDSQGNVWLAEQGFNGGDTIERSDLVITNTTNPEIYRSEHYSMDSFSWPLANGKYVVKLHFSECFEGITGPGERVFSFKVQDHEFKDFDVWVKAGGPYKAYVETVPVEITDSKLLITFTSKVENPQVNGIEIIPQP